MSRPVFTVHTTDTTSDAGRQIMATVQRKQGHVPTAVALLAESPELLKGFFAATAAFESTDLDPVAREVVVLTVATRNECHLCVAMHTATLTGLGGTPELIEALRSERTLPEPRLEALRRFTLAVLHHRGATPDDELDDFLAAGWRPRHALDVVLGVGAYTISTFANRLVAAPVDPPLAAYAWEPAA
ncbi:carboxymuconolactone decarboxylase family protein [Micromonospora mirobrigensis]|uniref:Alkylhydroperoxidase AhpD family core domain-containing protein n=1 Tax=Micromonospora mirobrigensis TaxID=262898 RepID=A0A1C4VGC2_9ACTN|nr:carboxymuconolactone decarboxylase family protein [Micromonospora mirobrigensis]SCE83028.1 alkylhydroperoxidase AhpD family core domain-containing protein [Micromonospora mirobrigensis]